MNEVKLNMTKISDNFFTKKPFMNKIGFIISQKYDCIIHYPISIDSHENSSFELLYLGYREFVNDCLTYIESVTSKIPSQICCINCPEMSYAMYFASLGEIVFLNSSIPNYKSGVLFLPKDIVDLSKNQLLAINYYLQGLINFDYIETLFVPKDLNNQFNFNENIVPINEAIKILTKKNN